MKRFAFVMAGGSGERFWPLSRAATPKHLLKLLGDRTLLASTVLRLEGLIPWEQVFVLTNIAQKSAVTEELPFLPPENIVAEPAKRDTAPACALATALARRHGDGLCALLPADAMIHDEASFRSQLDQAYHEAESSNAIVTFSVPPAYPSTGFGYLHLERGEGTGARKVLRFVEKPDLDTARSYLADGNYGWNAGIFLWKSSVFLSEAQLHAPALAAFIEGFPAGAFDAYLTEHFDRLPKISVDYAILEQAQSVRAIEAAFDWDDVGSWTALPQHLPSDDNGNCVRGEVATHESRNNIVLAGNRFIALCGVEDLVVVETEDAVLVCHRDAAQDLKQLQSEIPKHLR